MCLLSLFSLVLSVVGAQYIPQAPSFQAGVSSGGSDAGVLRPGSSDFPGPGSGINFPDSSGAQDSGTGPFQGSDQTITVTQITTYDTFSTVTETVYNSVPVTLTDFVKSTITAPTREVLRTPVDDVVHVTSVQVTRPTTFTVIDVRTIFSCDMQGSTDYYTITHRDNRIVQTTLTSTIVQTHTFRPRIVRTTIHTERVTETETNVITNTVWIEAYVATRYQTKIH